MDLNTILLVIFLFGVIYIFYLVKKNLLPYLLGVMLAFFILKKYTENQESFESQQEKDAINKLEEAVEDTRKSEELNERVSGLETNIEDLKKIIRAQNLSRQMDRGDDAKTFSMTESQKRQDSNLESLEKEVDILLKLYKKENEVNEKDKYKTLPIFSSCKVRDQGQKYIKDNRTTEQLVRDLEKTETMKNLGLNSDSAEELYNLIENDNSEHLDVNFNLI